MKRMFDLLFHAANRPQPRFRITFLCLLLGSAISASAQWLPTPYTSGPINFPGTNVGIATSDTSLANGCDAGLVIAGASPALRLRGSVGDLGNSNRRAFAGPPVPIGCAPARDFPL